MQKIVHLASWKPVRAAWEKKGILVDWKPERAVQEKVKDKKHTTMSRRITNSQLYYQGQKFKWYKNNSINLFQWQGIMFEDIGEMAESEPNEITSTWLYIFVFTLYSFHFTMISSY